jgi:hypothetical protein
MVRIEDVYDMDVTGRKIPVLTHWPGRVALDKAGVYGDVIRYIFR